MHDVQFADEILDRLKGGNVRFHANAYLFTLSALHSVMERLEAPRHISGSELAEGVRLLALDRFGPMARTVLEHWGVHRTEDLGDIVFTLVECGVLTKQDEDSRDDFRDVYDFEEEFDRNYPWEARV